jgi:hypothetical protein
VKLLKENLIQQVHSDNPGLMRRGIDIKPMVSDFLLSPFTIKLSTDIKDQIFKAVAELSKLRQQVVKPGPLSLMSSYDFHIDENRNIKLIEINTNAAFLIMSHSMYKLHNIKPVTSFGPEDFATVIKNEYFLWAQQSDKNLTPSPFHVSIIDNNPSEQRLYIEFLIAREWLEQQNISCDIRDTKDALNTPVPNLIYNRDTDFFLDAAEASKLKLAYNENSLCLSPNPADYKAFAHKQRFIEWQQPNFLQNLNLAPDTVQFLSSLFPACYDKSTTSLEDLWSRRKNLFFKPKSEYGSKKAFRGASISRRMFDELFIEDLMAQEYIPAPEVSFETPEGLQKFKFDLRCHFYGSRLEGVCARIYQGQVTNLKTPYGGFAPVVFE